MERVLFVAPQTNIPDSLSLLSHSISSASSLDEALRQVDLADCIVVGGHVDLAWARTATSTLNQAREHIPILLLLQPSSLSIINAEWGFADFAMIDARVLLIGMHREHRMSNLTRQWRPDASCWIIS